MGQDEVYTFLKNIFLGGDSNFYSVKEIYLKLDKVYSFKSIQSACSKLYYGGNFIERKEFFNIPKYRCNKRMI